MTLSTPDGTLIDEGAPVSIDGRVVLRPDDEAVAWRIVSGRAAVFAVETGDGRRYPLGIVEAPDLVFPCRGAAAKAGIDIIVTGIVPTILEPERMDELARTHPDLAGALERWIEMLARAAADLLPPSRDVPRPIHDQDAAVKLVIGEEVCGPAHGAVWLESPVDGVLFDVADVSPDAGLALTRSARLKPLANIAGVRLASTGATISNGRWRPALAAFQDSVLEAFATNLALAVVDEYNRDREQVEAESAAFAAVLRRAGDTVSLARVSAERDAHDDPVRAAVARVAEAVGGDASLPPTPPGSEDLPVEERIMRTAASAGFAVRPVALSSDGLRRQTQPTIALTEDGNPIVLLPRGRGGMDVLDPVAGTTVRVDGSLLSAVRRRAYAFSPTLPDRPATLGALAGLVWRTARADLLMVATYGVVAATLSLVPAVLLGVLVGDVVPGQDLRTLIELGLVLVAAGLAVAVFEFLKGIALVRAESIAETVAQPALIHRVLGLPIPFFRSRSTGEITQRVLGIGFARRLLAQGAVVAVLAVAFAAVNLVVMTLFSPILTAAAIAVLAVLAIVATFALRRAFGHERRALEIDGDLTDTALQLVRSADKIRVAGAEQRAFVRWYGRYVDKRREVQGARACETVIATLTTTAPLAVATAVFAVVLLANPDLSPAAFAAFGAALANVLVALAAVAGVVSPALSALILVERMRPLLDAAPERLSGTVDPGPLAGRIEVNGVSLGYGGTTVLRDVSLTVEPGSFVAIVGPSGAGKSSLLKIMLGLETPASGSVFYDGQDLARLDKRALRRQLGVVLQDGALLPGSILENLRASADVGLEEAWAALRQASFEMDVRAMPMGIHTFVAEGATLSGGQRQRLMLARALVRKPRILFLDEATSAVDEGTQATIVENLDGLGVTRVVIAHRLSTIRNADRIHVIVDGRVAESGTYDELMEAGEAFRALARRQMA